MSVLDSSDGSRRGRATAPHVTSILLPQPIPHRHAHLLPNSA